MMYNNHESQLTHGKRQGRQVTFLLKDMFCGKVTTEKFCKDNLQCVLNPLRSKDLISMSINYWTGTNYLKIPHFFFLIFLISKFYCKWKINLMGEIIHKPSVLQFRRIVFTYFDQRYTTMGLCTNYEIVFILDLWEKKTLQICSVYLNVLNIYYFQCQPDIKQRKQKNPNLVYNLQVPSPKHISPNSTCIVLRKLFCLFFPDEKSFF